ncbi:MAG: RDD family protein [Elusimicrobiota bacterium]
MSEDKPAGIWVRYVAHCIDVAVFALVCAAAFFFLGLLQYLFGFGDALAGFLFLAVCALLWGINWIYYFLWHWNGGQTLGKRWLGLMVVGDAHPLLDFRQANRRWLAYHLTYLTLGIGFIAAAFRDGKRALHDGFAGTRVIHVDPRRIWLEILAVLLLGLLPLLMPLMIVNTAWSTYKYYFTVQPDLVEIAARNSLGALRESVYRYRLDTGAFPPQLDAQTFQGKDGYVEVIPPLDLSHHGHAVDNSVVRGPRVIEDSGRWVYDPERGQVFIDCSHTDINGATIYNGW